MKHFSHPDDTQDDLRLDILQLIFHFRLDISQEGKGKEV